MGDGGVIGEGGTPTVRTVCVRGSNTFRDVKVSDTMLVVGFGGAKSGSGFRASGSPYLDRESRERSSDNRKTSRATAAKSSNVEVSSRCDVESGVVGSSVDRRRTRCSVVFFMGNEHIDAL